MLIEFSAENFRSIKNKCTLSMLASSDTSILNNLFNAENKSKTLKLLKTACIYGANASGKTNILKAAKTIKEIILNSINYKKGGLIPIEPFELDDNFLDKPSSFEFIFIQNNIKYAYGAKLNKKQVIEEYLYSWKTGRKRQIFERNYNNIDFNLPKTKEEDSLRLKIYSEDISDNILFLSLANRVNIFEVKEAFDWFDKKLRILLNQKSIGSITTHFLNTGQIKKEDILKYLKLADNQITSFNLTETIIDDEKEFPSFLKKHIMNTIAKKENININEADFRALEIEEKTIRQGLDIQGNAKNVEFSMAEKESDGTQKYYGVSGPIINSLNNGYVLLFDELDLRLHTLLSKNLIELFTSSINKNNAQLIFTSHDVNLLDNKNLFRRDQIWFTEKIKDGSTELYSLWDFKARKDITVQKGYLEGRYGAIPFINRESLL